MSTAYAFTYQGVTFKGAATWPFAVFTRSMGQGRPNLRTWHDMRYYSLEKTVRRVFTQSVDIFDRSDVYAVNCYEGKVIAHASQGQLLYDAIDPLKLYDARTDE